MRRGFPTRILEVEVSGVAEAIGNLTERGATDPVVKATLMLSESGFVSVTDAVAFGEIKDESIAGTWRCYTIERSNFKNSFVREAERSLRSR